MDLYTILTILRHRTDIGVKFLDIQMLNEGSYFTGGEENS